MTDVKAVLARAEDNIEESIGRWLDLLKIPSISTEPAYKADCLMAAHWLAKELKSLGFKANVRKTPGHPMVVGHYRTKNGAKDAPHVLFYGHYDVQPVDPIENWNSPPFEPKRMMDGDGVEKVYARGAADDKGQLMTFLEASRAWIEATGSLPLNLTVLFEGEEESGSPSLVPFLKENRKELSSDIALVCDTNMWNPKTPAITTRLRGNMHDEIFITGPEIDLHSGLFGGAAINPIRVLTRIVADIHDKRGRVTIPGFYEGVTELPRSTRRQWDDLKMTARKFLGPVGLKLAAGETNRSVLEQIWSRPTVDANGIIAGYTGKGTKTVIPSKASAKISFRLVGKQDPKKIRKAFRQFVKQRVPSDCTVEFGDASSGSPAIEIPEDNAYLQIAATALKDEFRKEPVMMGCGGSIPIVSFFQDILGMDSLLIGFGLNDDAIHSPNEKYNLSSFRSGIRSWARIIGKLAQDQSD